MADPDRGDGTHRVLFIKIRVPVNLDSRDGFFYVAGIKIGPKIVRKIVNQKLHNNARLLVTSPAEARC